MRLTINDRTRDLAPEPHETLLTTLRDRLFLTGAKQGCDRGECGACTVLLDGKAVNSCLVPVAQAAGSEVRTIEGLRGRHPLQRAFAELGGTQCGICTPGMVLAAIALGPRPTLDEVRTGLAGNICRCTGYEGIYRAIQRSGGRIQNPESRIQKPEAGRRKRARAKGNAKAGRRR